MGFFNAFCYKYGLECCLVERFSLTSIPRIFGRVLPFISRTPVKSVEFVLMKKSHFLKSLLYRDLCRLLGSCHSVVKTDPQNTLG